MKPGVSAGDHAGGEPGNCGRRRDGEPGVYVHECRIHGRRYAGVRIVQEGPTLVHTLELTSRTRVRFRCRICCRIGQPKSPVPATGDEQ